MGIVSQKLRNSARGQRCTLEIVGVCNHDPETTVLAHLPSAVKGLATKSDDFHGIFACSECHDALDQHRIIGQGEDWYCLRALQRTIKFWIDNGYLTIGGDNERPRKPSNKILPRRSLARIEMQGEE